MTTASRLNIFVSTWNFVRTLIHTLIPDICSVFITSAFYANLQVLATINVKKHGNSWLSPRVWVMRGSTNLQCLNFQSVMCNWSCVVELLCHNRWVPFQNDGLSCSTSTIIMIFYQQVYALWIQTNWLSF